MVRVQMIVGGYVQGVGFRWFIRDQAEELGLTGTVKNLISGDVEIWAEGDREEIEKLVVSIRQGNGFSRANKIDREWSQATGEWSTFSIVVPEKN